MGEDQLRAIVRRNLERVRAEVANAAAEAGRDAAEITLVGVSKYVDATATAVLVDAGLCDLGEARPQQLWDKASDPRLAPMAPVRWHLIGHLQRNKADRTVPLAALVHSVDSGRLLAAVDKAAAAAGKRQAVLLEINCSGDSEKYGLAPAEAIDLVEQAGGMAGVSLQGLMTMGAREGGTTVARRNFADLRELRDNLVSESGVTLPILSMGMSGDFREAILEGATHVRIGSALWTGVDPWSRQ
ncbi:Pyridoxal phosphate homeostasis protein [Pirellulimonas nuda]|uniref:Pyridoxal phosphate homeostasis protein n=1 Tax=Pirellulimonas nuda TaxID=2528009 RepID=A0A518DB24_9BACT|nr:YggS family pyridoxal phosphate-dependent enzyme [Pirellulimonas nuda]QDU88691.1 Pyridoxal phosphate homeostasis protein [Pirellulimonas nuda]